MGSGVASVCELEQSPLEDVPEHESDHEDEGAEGIDDRDEAEALREVHAAHRDAEERVDGGCEGGVGDGAVVGGGVDRDGEGGGGEDERQQLDREEEREVEVEVVEVEAAVVVAVAVVAVAVGGPPPGSGSTSRPTTRGTHP